jgi:N utilization substance protein B
VKKVTTNNQPAKRTLSREYAFKFLYKHLMPEFEVEKKEFLTNSIKFESAVSEFDLSFQEHDDEHPNNTIDFNTRKFAKELIIGSLKNEDTSLKSIEKFLSNKNLEKVDRMNLSVLILGVYELKNDTTNSPGIFINEYVNIAKKYCPNDSAGFINSVLDKVAKE